MLRVTVRRRSPQRPSAPRWAKLFSWTAALAVAAGTVGAGRPARAEGVMDQVPGEALLVLKVNNLQAVSGKVAALAQQFGLALMDPKLNDPLGALLQTARLNAGVKKDGDLALVVLDAPGAPGAGPEGAPAGMMQPPSFIALVPVSDYQGFMGNFPDAKADGDVTSFTSPTRKPLFAVKWGEFAAISPFKDSLSKKPTGLKVEGATGRELASKDAVLFVNMKVIGPRVLPMLKQNKEKILDTLQQQMANNPQFDQKNAPLIKAIMGQYLAVAEEFLQDATASSVSLNLSKEGIATSVMAEFEPSSYIGKMAKEMNGKGGSLLAGLPDGKYLFYGGSSFDGKTMARVAEDLLKPVMDELAKAGGDAKAVAESLELMKKSLNAQQSSSFAMIAPTGVVGKSPLMQVISVTTGDAQTLLMAQQKTLEGEAAGVAGNPMLRGAKIAFKANAKGVDGVQFNEFSVSLLPNPQTPQEAQVADVIRFIFGPNGMQGYVGAADDKHVVMGLGVDDETLSKLVASAKSGADAISKNEGVASVTKNLPPNRVAEFYIPVDTIASTVTGYARQFKMVLPFNLAPNLPPIGGAVATDGSAIRIDSYTPSQLVSSLIAAGLQTWMQMNGGGQPGGPGGL